MTVSPVTTCRRAAVTARARLLHVPESHGPGPVLITDAPQQPGGSGAGRGGDSDAGAAGGGCRVSAAGVAAGVAARTAAAAAAAATAAGTTNGAPGTTNGAAAGAVGAVAATAAGAAPLILLVMLVLVVHVAGLWPARPQARHADRRPTPWTPLTLTLSFLSLNK